MAEGKQVFEDPDSYGGEEVKSVIQKKHNKISMEALILLSDNEESHRYALGPTFMHEYTMRLQNYYPGMGGKFLFHDFALDWSKWHLSNPVENWPIPNENWTNWVDRVADAKGDLWKEIGIYDAIMLSKIRIEIDKHLFFAALFFWSVPANSFHLNCGMMSPTILDIAALTGLRLHGEEVSAVFSTAKSPCPISYSKTMTAYDKFIDLSIDPNGVTEDEHVRFLVMWLNKFLFCNASHKITKDYTELAIALAAGRKLALAPLVLFHLYRVLAEFLNRKFLNTDGPFWLLHLWLQAYFPEIGPIIVPWNDAPTYGFIYALSTPRPKTFEECFTFFYSECVSRTPIQYTPFSSRTRGPDWFLARPGLAPPEAWEEHTELWASYLIAREYTSTWLLIIHLPKCGVEYYAPNQLARQFGLTQFIPIPPYQLVNRLLVRREKFTTIEEVEGISDQFKTLKKKFRMEAFLEAPQSSLYFDLWWTPYITKLKAEKIEDVLKRISPISIPPTASLKLGEGLITSNPRPAQIAGKKKRRSKPLLKDTISTKILKIKSVEINDDSHDLQKVVLPKELQPQKKSVKENSSTKDDETTTTLHAKTSAIGAETTEPVEQTNYSVMVFSSLLSNKVPCPISKDAIESSSPEISKEQVKESAELEVKVNPERSGASTVQPEALACTISVSQPSSKAIEKANEISKNILLTPFKDLVHPDRCIELELVLSTLLWASGFNPEQYEALRRFKEEFPVLTVDYEVSKATQENSEGKLNAIEILSTELVEGLVNYKKMRTSKQNLKEEQDTEAEILQLKIRLAKVVKEEEELEKKMQELTEITCAKNIQHEKAKVEVTALMVWKRRAEWFLA
ncbi:uncharacterized protein LOC114284348 isoform X3 [Camellia sinensis]|uniref:uncharacterized protein LOC114284348 isoform X3 n=1 Tax=Camellia sinensis TaxID=4442 RepID=UPI001036B43B|nr:uncharacterized protein LOC114284348 isoform X3 [Camellia sinensis]